MRLTGVSSSISELNQQLCELNAHQHGCGVCLLVIKIQKHLLGDNLKNKLFVFNLLNFNVKVKHHYG